MDLLWDSMPSGMRGRDMQSNTLPRSFSPMSRTVAGQPKSRRSLTSFPRYGTAGRDRKMDNYRPVSFHDDVFPSFLKSNDDIAHRISIHHDSSPTPAPPPRDDAFMVSPLSSDIEDIFRNHRSALSVSNGSRDIPIMRENGGGNVINFTREDGGHPDGHVINIIREDSDPYAYRRMSDTFADPRSRLYANRLGRNVHFADDMNDTGSGHKVDIARDSHAEKQSEQTDTAEKEEANEDKEQDLVVKNIDCHVTENAQAHHTNLFQHVEKGLLIVRRGQKFEITVALNRPFDILKDQLCLTFQTGHQEQPGKGNHVSLKIPDRIFSSVWHAEIVNNNESNLKIAIRPDATCIVGEWKMSVLPVCRKQGADEKEKYRYLYARNNPEIPLYILFNPWNREDHTFFPDSNKLSEYVLNDSGCIFVGTDKQISAIPWFYGQFELGVLEAAVYCLRKAFQFQPNKGMGDPVRVTRAISRVVNSNDDNGVLVGSWSGKYMDGTAPQMWPGSVAILRKYLTNKRSVKYGQCFVFAGVVTTICRALGLPCRTVTNFFSARDTDGNLSLDVHWDLVESKEINSLNTDNMWNFHIWNDVWMARKDLPFGNDGWQVIDATPQETSGGKYACGPASVNAILNGRCDVTHDVSLIFAELNADRVHWGRHKDGSWSVIGIDKAATGKKMCTKAADGRPVPSSFTHCDSFLEDITSQYKRPEDSSRERMSMMLASTLSPRARKDILNQGENIEVEIKCPEHQVIGSDVSVTITCKNKSGEQMTAEGKLVIDVISYTGKTISTCKEDDLSLKLAIYDRHIHNTHIKAEQYLKQLGEMVMLKVSLLLTIKETGQVIAKQDVFRFRSPELKLKCFNTTCQVGRPLALQCSLKNPLQDHPLTGCYLYVECSGMDEPKLVTLRSVQPSREMACDVDLTVMQKGRRQIFATFHCNEINDVKGVLDIYMQ